MLKEIKEWFLSLDDELVDDIVSGLYLYVTFS